MAQRFTQHPRECELTQDTTAPILTEAARAAAYLIGGLGVVCGSVYFVGEW